LTYPDGKEVTYGYNASGRLETVTDTIINTTTNATATPEVTRYIYNPHGRVSERVLPEGTTTKYEYNPLGALASLTHSRDSTTILDQFIYSHDPAGNITQIEKHRTGIEADNGVFKYAYDPLNRLVEATTGAGKTKQYCYDSLGNRISSLQIDQDQGASTEIRHTFNARNQLVKTFGDDGTNASETIYQYDKRGNLTHVAENGQLKAGYTFDATNMMIAAHNPAKGTAEYFYNGFRSRVKKLENFHNTQTIANATTPDPTTEVRYVLDMTLPYDNLIMTHGAQNQSFTWGNGLLSGSGHADKANQASPATGSPTHYYLQDHLGSPIRLFGENGHDDIFAYDEFGVSELGHGQSTQSHMADFINPFGFTGYQSDDISDMYYAQARYYSPTAGRFMAEDPIKDQLNWYEYCNANPMAFIDPTGLFQSAMSSSFVGMTPGYLFDSGPGGGPVTTTTTTAPRSQPRSNPEQLHPKKLPSANNVSYPQDGYSGVTPKQRPPLLDGFAQVHAGGAQPAIDRAAAVTAAVVDFGHALYNSVSVSGSIGVGIGGEAKLGPLKVTAQVQMDAAPSVRINSGGIGDRYGMGGEISIRLLGETSSSGEIGQGLWALGAGIRMSSSGETANTYGLIRAPDRRIDVYAGLKGPGGITIGPSNIERNPDIRLAVGAGLYIGIGGSVSASLNLSEFRRTWNERRSCE